MSPTGRNRGISLMIAGLALFLGGPLCAIGFWYVLGDHPRIATVAAIAAQATGVALIVAGAIRSSRHSRQPAPPLTPN